MGSSCNVLAQQHSSCHALSSHTHQHGCYWTTALCKYWSYAPLKWPSTGAWSTMSSSGNVLAQQHPSCHALSSHTHQHGCYWTPALCKYWSYAPLKWPSTGAWSTMSSSCNVLAQQHPSFHALSSHTHQHGCYWTTALCKYWSYAPLK